WEMFAPRAIATSRKGKRPTICAIPSGRRNNSREYPRDKQAEDQMLIDPILANMGLPMVAVYLPFAWLALVPIILIEAGYGTRRYQLSLGRALVAQAIANGFSSVIGIPMTWFAIVLIQVAIIPGGIGLAWLAPDPSWWSVALAVAVLTVLFYLMSVATEGF